MSSSQARVVLYILRRDIRLSDNPAFHFAAQQFRNKKASKPPASGDGRTRDTSINAEHGSAPFTHLLPVYVFPSNQIESSGFLSSPSERSPYPEARSQVARVWRTGPHRARFIGEGVWDLRKRLEALKCGSGLEMRVGMVEDVVRDILESYQQYDGDKAESKITHVWMTKDEGTEEKDDERRVEKLAVQHGAEFKAWADEKFYVDDRDLPYKNISELPNVYTTYRKSLEPLRGCPRKTLPTPKQLPPLPSYIPPQKAPFTIPTSREALIDSLLSPLRKDPSYTLTTPPQWPTDVQSAHPFEGGESSGLARIAHLVSTGAMSTYKATRNGMLGLDFSTKLSAFLAQGHITARQVHWAMLEFEEGRGEGKDAVGYGKGENEGTAAVRFELLWRDYFQLCMRKFGHKMFALYGIQPHAKQGSDEQQGRLKRWRHLDHSNGEGDDPKKTQESFLRFRSGCTGIGLIDASNRELFLTGYTSNRARQNVASFLSSHLDIDWRIGAEWYEFLLIDYDTASNWGNWQYVAGVGNDPRQGRIFNPVKQALDYDPHGEYIKAWVPELRGIKLTRSVGSNKEEIDPQKLMALYQAWKLSDWEKRDLGLKGVEWIEQPLTRIQFSIGRRHPADGRGKRGGGGGGHWRGGGRGGGNRGSKDIRRTVNEEKPINRQKYHDGPTIVSS